MLFNSFAFLLFFAIVFSVTLCLRHRAQNLWLLLASYLFYAAWDWRFLLLILLSTVIDYAAGLALGASESPRRRRAIVAASVVANLSILGFFKYAGFFAESLRELLGLFGVRLSDWTLDVVLPVGISFYTFQTMSYAIDVHRRRLAPTRRFLDFALFVAFFPQLVAGPIERAANLLPQVVHPRRITWEKVGRGAWLALWGLFKKVVIADNLWPLVDSVYGAGAHPTGAEVLVASYAFGIAIYCDFSGYSDIARGTARLLGFELMLNFDLPYFTRNLQDFWRRWHISLSSWLRDYLYIPLGGNRTHPVRNLWLTMVLCGLWHGAGWNFVAFGAYHGTLMVLYRASERWRRRALRFRSAAARRGWAIASVALTFHVAILGWIFFRAETLARAVELWGALASEPGLGLVPAWAPRLALLLLPLALVDGAQLATGDLEFVHRLRWPARTLLYAALVLGIALVGEDFGEEFVYFRF
jgi:D-alanyl-lipoteichoic acid acyltransferase DltB (MBOAT superfamily)